MIDLNLQLTLFRRGEPRPRSWTAKNGKPEMMLGVPVHLEDHPFLDVSG